MLASQMFELDSHHVLLAASGACVILAYWLPRFVSGREPVASALLMLAGAVAYGALPGMPAALDPTVSPRLWELVSELTVVVALFGAGLRIDNLFVATSWRPTLRLLVVALPLTIAVVAWLGVTLGGLTLAGALLLAAVLSPTDPVLAGDLQVGPPLEGGEHPVRFVLTTEAGLNDGLAFPFVLLGLAVATEGVAPGSWGAEWLARDLLYRIAVGVLAGAAIGWLLGKIVFAIPRANALARTESGVVAIAGVLVSYGLTELVEGYGFVAVFVTGLVLRRAEEDHEFHRRLHALQRVHRACADGVGVDHAGRRTAVAVARARLALSRRRAPAAARRAAVGRLVVVARHATARLENVRPSRSTVSAASARSTT